MTAALISAVVVLAGAFTWLLVVHLRYRRGGPSRAPVGSSRRILFPFVADALSARALDAALRLARAEEATLVPVFLARVSLHLPLDTPLPRQSAIALPLQEAIEHRARAFGISVDNRVQRGRSYRHALRETIVHERFDRIVIAAAAAGGAGFHADDVAWLLDHAPGEIVVLRPDRDEVIRPPEARRVLASRNGSTPEHDRIPAQAAKR